MSLCFSFEIMHLDTEHLWRLPGPILGEDILHCLCHLHGASLEIVRATYAFVWPTPVILHDKDLIQMTSLINCGRQKMQTGKQWAQA